ncbi:hypothetical protein QOK74_08325 [Staphylococcus saprophyticus]|uniref:hypothetical protein n=1 Tax=Staphylococcus saprophyticus TaxID=29385 RepID=UPI0024C2A327|nr:hypothetical protein [Staphylococcus saprophyticus]MDK1672877.1 hypothetical protein [Staphylococcus saprophyticus]
MTIKTNMNTTEKFERFTNMISDKLEIVKEYEKDQESTEHNEILGAIVELTTMIFTTKELTEITENEIELYLKKEINMTIEQLQHIENSLY